MSDEMIAMEHELRRRADEITSLRAEVEETKGYWNECDAERRRVHAEMERLRAEVEKWKARFDRSEDLRVYLRKEERRGTWITDEQIDKAWYAATKAGIGMASGTTALWRLGIVECPECEGVGVGVSEHCTNCGGHGWIREEHGDE